MDMRASPPPDRRSTLEHPAVRGVIALVLLGAIAAGTLLFTRGGSGDTKSPVDGTPVTSADIGPLASNPPAVGETAPDFALKDVSGHVVKLSDLRGKVVWVNFWATWCIPCKQELPDIQAIYSEKKAQGLEVLEVNWDETADLAKPYFQQRHLTMPVLLDSAGDVFKQYKLTGVPDSFFIGRDGKISSLYFGQLSQDKMREHLATAGLQ